MKAAGPGKEPDMLYRGSIKPYVDAFLAVGMSDEPYENNASFIRQLSYWVIIVAGQQRFIKSLSYPRAISQV